MLTGVNFAEHWAPLQTAAGLRNIVRQNIYIDGYGVEAVSSEAGSWAVNAAKIRIYNNTYFGMGGPAWGIRWYDGGTTVGESAFVNNIVVDSRKSPKTSFYDTDCYFVLDGAPVEATGKNFVGGNLFAPAAGKVPTITVSGGGGRMTLADAEKSYPNVFKLNRAGRPEFVSANPKVSADFDLQLASAGVDSGIFLTRATGTGRSAKLPVGDPLYFTDGFGLVQGDLIQLEGQSDRARVVGVDASAGLLLLSSPVDFSSGQGVALAYGGSAPDAGARERDLSGKSAQPLPPDPVVVE